MQIIRQEKKSVVRHYCREETKVLELVIAKEILAEVFAVRISEVEEMIQNRFEEDRSADALFEKKKLWPEDFRLDD